MKKSSSYIYPRPIARKRRSWRFVSLLVCAVAAACFFLVEGIEWSFLTPGQDMTAASTQGAPVWDQSELNEEELALLQPLPALIEVSLSSSELAARAALAEEEPERPGMFMATLGEGIARLQSLPFFLPADDEEVLLSHGDDDGAADFAEEGSSSMFKEILLEISSAPVVYSENERYTVEWDGTGKEIFRSTVAKGDAAGVILNEWLPSGEVHQIIATAESIYPLKSIVVGRPFSITRDATTEEVLSFIYETGPTERLVVERQEEGFKAFKEAIEFDTQLVRVEGNINSNLFEAVAQTGEGPVLAIKLAEVFSCEVNFINEIRKGDAFEVVVEKLYRDGEFKGYGQMIAAHFSNRGRTYEAYLFPDEKGVLRYYNANGEALQKAFLKAPLSFTRVSSGYSMNRRHPVLGYSRPHQGIDYAAPSGTPIMAVGDGVVTRAGWGDGYGNMVVIQHSKSLSSQYAHMSGFAKGIKKGTQVRQGQIIGYVGATGLATGPHLDFRIIENGKFTDPSKVIVPRLDPVDKGRMPVFQSTMATALGYLKGDTSLAEYAPFAWDK